MKLFKNLFRDKIQGVMAAFLSIVLVITTFLSVMAPVTIYAANNFTDVPSTFWAYTEITEAVNKGITNGYADGTFKPRNSVTNAHFCAFLARAFYADEYVDGTKSPWYKVYTDVLDEHGILDRTTLSKDFDGNINKPINRYDMAQMMRHILDDKNAEMPTNEEMAAARNAIGDWDGVPAEYRGAVSLCYAMGVLNGQSDGNFGGNNLMNRGQGCVVVYRLTQKIETGSTGIEPSVPEKPEEPSNPSTSTQTLTNGKPVTVENVSELLAELKETKYPHKGTYDPYEPQYYFACKNSYGIECAKLAYTISDEIFGVDASIRTHTNYGDVKPGDIIECKDENGNTFHWATIYEIDASGRYRGVGGGPSGIILWNEIGNTAKWDNEVVWTRYPV